MADFGGNVAGTGLNTIMAVGLEETAYNTAAASEMWSSLVDSFNPSREDTVYSARGMTNVRTMTAQQIIASKYPVSIRGKVDSGVPFAMIGGYISGVTDPTISIFRGASHSTPSKVYLPSWTLKRSFDDESDSLNILGVTFDTGTFTCDLDGPWMFDLSGVGKSQAAVAATGVNIPAFMLGSWNTTTKIKVDGATYSSAGALTIEGIRNLAFSIANNLKIRPEFGASAPVAIRQPKAGIVDIELRITRGYIDDDIWVQIADGGVNSFEIATTDGTVTLTNEFDNCLTKKTDQTTPNDDETNEVCVLSVKDWNCIVSSDGASYVTWD